MCTCNKRQPAIVLLSYLSFFSCTPMPLLVQPRRCLTYHTPSSAALLLHARFQRSLPFIGCKEWLSRSRSQTLLAQLSHVSLPIVVTLWPSFLLFIRLCLQHMAALFSQHFVLTFPDFQKPVRTYADKYTGTPGSKHYQMWGSFAQICPNQHLLSNTLCMLTHFDSSAFPLLCCLRRIPLLAMSVFQPAMCV